MHRFADNCEVERWHRWIDDCKRLQKKENVLYFGMGDYDDAFSRGERKALLSAMLHDTSMRSLDDLKQKHTDDYIKELAFMKGNLIGMIEGNHHYTFLSGITGTQKMCEALETKYLGEMAVVRVTFVDKTRSTRRACIDITAHHGRGGGRRPGSSVNKVEDLMQVVEADVYLMGHDHQKWIVDKARLKPTHSKSGFHIKQRDVILARTGSYQLGYVDGQSNYPISLAAAPAKLGGVQIKVDIERSCKDRKDVMHVRLGGSLL